MKLSQLRLRNFRCFQEEITIDFEDLTALIGRNDAGKSSIMDSLDIFLNDGFPDKNDASKNGDSDNLSIACIFSDFPDSLVLDEDYSTSLQKEYLLNPDGYLEIHKVFSGGLEKPKLKILKLVANHPTAENITDLISLNNTELKKRAKDLGIITSGIDLKINAQLRQVIRESVDNLKLASVEIDLLDGNGKKLWSGIQAKLPAFGLFKSDRASTDQDAEVQDPLNTAIQAAIKSQEIELNKIALHIQSEVKKVADLTLKKLQEMDATLATTLSPQFSPPRWAGLFKASITGDNNIPINKRGSGVRRLILLSFFRAQVELHKNEKNKQNILYAIEEPETSQHPHNQRLLVSALQELAGDNQVIITTHTPMLARIIPAKALRFIRAKEDNPNTREIILGGSEETNKLIANSLGVLPDHNVKLFIGVEGKHDLPFLKNMSRLLISAGVAAPNLEQLELDGKLIFTPLGGSGLALWCNRLSNLNRPEFHLYDRDYDHVNNMPYSSSKYQKQIDEINKREGCKAVATTRREAENYIHQNAINAALADAGISVRFNKSIGEFDDLPKELTEEVNKVIPGSNRWGVNRAKDFLCNLALSKMDKSMLDEIDPQGEVMGWFSDIQRMLESTA